MSNLKYYNSPISIIARNIQTKETIITESITEMANILGTNQGTLSNNLKYKNTLYNNIWLLDYPNNQNTHLSNYIANKYWDKLELKRKNKNKQLDKTKIKIIINTKTKKYLKTKSIIKFYKFTTLSIKDISYLLKNKIYKKDDCIVFYLTTKSKKLTKLLEQYLDKNTIKNIYNST